MSPRSWKFFLYQACKGMCSQKNIQNHFFFLQRPPIKMVFKMGQIKAILPLKCAYIVSNEMRSVVNIVQVRYTPQGNKFYVFTGSSMQLRFDKWWSSLRPVLCNFC